MTQFPIPAEKATTGLPDEILLSIIQHLNLRDFISFISACKEFYEFRAEATYWREVTSNTFRVPNRPVTRNDGVHWRNLFRRMLTATKVYTWGSNTFSCLGPSFQEPPPRQSPLRRIRRLPPHVGQRSWPQEVQQAPELGVIADLQCGGWSTNILNNNGVIHTVGALNGEGFGSGTNREFRPLKFPDTLASARSDGSNSHTAIAAFSAGRSHLLGLADDGTVWSWSDCQEPATEIRLEDVDIIRARNPDMGGSATAMNNERHGKVVSVVAGWNKSSAYVIGAGILLWDLRSNRQDVNTGPASPVRLLDDYNPIGRTSYRRPDRQLRDPDDESKALGAEVGEVKSHVLLETHVVFVTDLGKVLACPIAWANDNGPGPHTTTIHGVFELSELQATSLSDDKPIAADVQGSFRTFAVFRTDGTVLVSNEDYITAVQQRLSSRPAPTRIPALQNTGVVQLAFGDYHFHALHTSGAVTSYGYDPQGCGSLGLEPEVRNGAPSVRGRYIEVPYPGDALLTPHAYLPPGRRVYFQPEQADFLLELRRSGQAYLEANAHAFHPSNEFLGELAEWTEQQLRDWEHQSALSVKDTDGLGSHFVLAVAAAGWHSGAVVLVNRDLEAAVREACLQPDGSYKWRDRGFPRLRLASGEEMPGDGPLAEWRLGRPKGMGRFRYGGTGKVFGVRGWTYDEPREGLEES